jgi:hypothetical protein
MARRTWLIIGGILLALIGCVLLGCFLLGGLLILRSAPAPKAAIQPRYTRAPTDMPVTPAATPTPGVPGGTSLPSASGTPPPASAGTARPIATPTTPRLTEGQAVSQIQNTLAGTGLEIISVAFLDAESGGRVLSLDYRTDIEPKTAAFLAQLKQPVISAAPFMLQTDPAPSSLIIAAYEDRSKTEELATLILSRGEIEVWLNGEVSDEAFVSSWKVDYFEGPSPVGPPPPLVVDTPIPPSIED